MKTIDFPRRKSATATISWCFFFASFSLKIERTRTSRLVKAGRSFRVSFKAPSDSFAKLCMIMNYPDSPRGTCLSAAYFVRRKIMIQKADLFCLLIALRQKLSFFFTRPCGHINPAFSNGRINFIFSDMHIFFLYFFISDSNNENWYTASN